MSNPWNERFAQETYVYGKNPNAFVEQIASQLPQGKVLCIAEGEGRNAVYLAQFGHEVSAWDYAQSGLNKTKQLATEKGVAVQTVLHDLATVEWGTDEWDAIVHIFGHFPKPVLERTWKGIEQALKPNGLYVAELYTKEQLHYGTGGPQNEALLVNPVEMLQQFSSFFVKHFYIGEVDRHEGELHNGRAHVVQAMFQKR